MFGGNGIHGWWKKIAALTAEEPRPPLYQTGRSRDGGEGEFVGVVGGRFLPSESVFSGGLQLAVGPLTSVNGGKGQRKEQKAAGRFQRG